MSWFVNSLANSLKLDDPDHDHDHDNNNPNSETDTETDNNNNNNDSSPTPNRGVKDDLTELSKTFTRQLWGVASFLAPPPPPTAADADADVNDGGDAATIAGIRNDLSEIGGKFKTEISKLKGVSELTKMATNLLHFGDDGDLSVQDFADRGVVGVTDEVVGFVRDVAMHPETWLDFPLPDDFDEDEDDEGSRLG